MRRFFVQGVPYWRIERKDIKKDLPQLLPRGNPNAITLHWTAGSYTAPYKAYQILISTNHILVSERLLDYMRHGHTWRRNTGNIGVSFMAMAGATERNAGHFPITPDMVEMAALTVGMLQRKYGLGKGALYDHAHWARVDGYAGLRWDATFVLPWAGETVTDVVTTKAWWYRERVSV